MNDLVEIILCRLIVHRLRQFNVTEVKQISWRKKLSLISSVLTIHVGFLKFPLVRDDLPVNQCNFEERYRHTMQNSVPESWIFYYVPCVMCTEAQLLDVIESL